MLLRRKEKATGSDFCDAKRKVSFSCVVVRVRKLKSANILGLGESIDEVDVGGDELVLGKEVERNGAVDGLFVVTGHRLLDFILLSEEGIRDGIKKLEALEAEELAGLGLSGGVKRSVRLK